MSLLHLVKPRQPREQREISEVQDRDHGGQTSARDLVRRFNEDMRSKYRNYKSVRNKESSSASLITRGLRLQRIIGR